jgi:hypothetical protein
MTTAAGAHIDLRKLEQIRERLRLEWSELAAIIGVDQSTLYRWRHGETSPRPLAWSRLAQLDEMMQLFHRLFAGADRAREWLRESTPEMLGGQTPLAVMRAGRIDRVLTFLHFLARGA